MYIATHFRGSPEICRTFVCQSETTLHVATGTAFFLEYCGNLVDEILKGEWAPREETIGGHFWKDRNKKFGVRV